MLLNPTNVQNVVTYNVVIDVSNPEQKLKPGMTANLTIMIDERNNVLKVQNAALRFRPQDTTGQSNANGNSNGQGRRQSANADASPNANSPSPQSSPRAAGNESNFAPASAPVLAGQTRVVWVLGADNKPQARRIKVGLTDGVATEVVEGNLQEGEMVVTGQTLAGAAKPAAANTAPGFGGAPRTGAPGGGGRRN